MALIPYFTAMHHHSGGLTQNHGVTRCLLLYINSSIPRSGASSVNTESGLRLNTRRRMPWMQSDLLNNPSYREPSINLCKFFLLGNHL